MLHILKPYFQFSYYINSIYVYDSSTVCIYDFTPDRRKSQPTVKWLSSMAQFSEWLFINLG